MEFLQNHSKIAHSNSRIEHMAWLASDASTHLEGQAQQGQRGRPVRHQEMLVQRRYPAARKLVSGSVLVATQRTLLLSDHLLASYCCCCSLQACRCLHRASTDSTDLA